LSAFDELLGRHGLTPRDIQVSHALASRVWRGVLGPELRRVLEAVDYCLSRARDDAPGFATAEGALAFRDGRNLIAEVLRV
jgi:hypothetical protein